MLDEFLSVADRSTGQEELTLGSCQVASMVGDLKLPASLFDLTLVSLFEDQAAVDRAVYRAQSDKHRLVTRWLATFFVNRKGLHFFGKLGSKLCEFVCLFAAGGSEKVFSLDKRLNQRHLNHSTVAVLLRVMLVVVVAGLLPARAK